MNLGGGQNTEGSNAGGIFVQFNQDCTSLVAGSSSGYHLFALTPDDGVEEIYASRSGQDTCLVDRLFSSSLVAVVTLAAPRKLIVCHYKKGTEICNYSYSNTILAVKLNRSRLVVCLEESLHIHNIRDMKILHTIRDTPPNPRGLCALAPCADRCLLAYPGSATAGEVQIFDAVHLNALCVVGAHDAPLAALAWSACGRRLATASERGTVLRVYGVPERARLYELRRGVKRCVTISCLAFSACGHYLAAASNTETVHVFRLAEGEGGEVAAPRRWRRARVCCRRTWARCWRRVARSPPRACPSPGPGWSPQSPPRRRGPRGCWWRRRRACCTCTAWTRPRAVTARCCARTTCSAPDRTPRPPGTPRRPAATTRAR